jgi:hypothetical protein
MWIIGKQYLRRNGGLAEYSGVVGNMPSFLHPDILPQFGTRISMHRWDGTMMCHPGHTIECAPYDIVEVDSQVMKEVVRKTVEV